VLPPQAKACPPQNYFPGAGADMKSRQMCLFLAEHYMLQCSHLLNSIRFISGVFQHPNSHLLTYLLTYMS